MKRVSPARCLYGLLLALPVAAPTYGFPLTGEWEGNVVCQTFDGTQRRIPAVGTTLKITQVGPQLFVQAQDGNGARNYNGEAIEDVGQPLRVRAVLMECRSTVSLDNYSEVVHLLGNATSKLRLQGKSILRNQNGDIGTCRWTFQRTSPVNPNMSACP